MDNRLSLDFTKIDHNIQQQPQQPQQPYVVLALSGALSPVHNMHLHCLELARRELTHRHRTVVGAFLCPSSDSYVQHKLGGEAIPLRHRNYLAQLATVDSEWIGVNTWGWGGAFHILSKTTELLKHRFPHYSFEVWLVVGADHATKHELYLRNSSIVCIGRPGETHTLLNAIKNNHSSKNKHRQSKGVSDAFILVTEEEEAEDVSSTKVRKLIKAANWEEIKVIVPVLVVDCMQKMGQSIFEK